MPLKVRLGPQLCNKVKNDREGGQDLAVKTKWHVGLIHL